jgi:EAL domain-containing protein (putative c-di-GMP-specific phosphodiesterase class I)
MIGVRRRTRSAADDSADPADSSLPRLSLRFAIYTAVGLSFAAALIIVFVRSYTIDQAEASVKRHSRVVARATLAEELRAADFTMPVDQQRRAELDRIFRGRVLADGIVQARLIGRNGIVTYAVNHSLIGYPARDRADVQSALGGTSLHTRTGTRKSAGRSQNVMNVFIPVRFSDSRPAGVFVLSHNWEPALTSARKTFIPIIGVLELVLLALYASFVPVLRRVTNRLRQLDETQPQELPAPPPTDDDVRTPKPTNGIDSDLQAAIEADELVLDFQPKFDLRTGTIVSAEALVRWCDPNRGLLQPVDFLKTASETGQMPALTRWVVDAALRACRAWRDSGWRLPVAVNVDARRLLDESFVDEIEGALTRNGIEPELLELEISGERATIESETFAFVASWLSELGVKLALDNVGGDGFSSLTWLQRLPIDELKVDVSLVAQLGMDPTGEPIVQSIVSLGNTRGVRVVAEGIETPEALQAVLAAKCVFGQGFHLAEPLPSDEFKLVLEYTHQHEHAVAMA